MRCRWSRVVLALCFLLAIKHHLTQVLDPWRMVDDARQHVFWTYRFADPSLFPDDLLVRFISGPRFDPPGYAALYAVATRWIDPLLFSKCLGLVLCIVAGMLAWRATRRVGGDSAGFLAAVIFGVLDFDNMRGGLPRTFAFPLIFLFLDGLFARRLAQAGLSMVAAALFYPPLVVSFGVLLPLFAVEGGRFRFPPLRRLVPGLVLPGLATLAILSSSYLVGGEDLAGPLVTREQAAAMPEFHSGGRNEFWDPDPLIFTIGPWSVPAERLFGPEAARALAYWLGNWTYNRSACGLFTSTVAWPLLMCLILLAVRRRAFRCPMEITALLVSSLALFLIAHALLFKLFQPSRYTHYTWPVALTILAAINGAPLLEPRLRALAARVPPRKAATAGLVLFAVLATALIVRAIAVTPRPRAPERVKLYETIAALPKDVVIAGWPHDLDDVPILTRRSVLANYELSLAWYPRYYERVRARIVDSIRLQLAPDRATVLEIAGRHGITHVLVSHRHLEAFRSGKAPITYPPFDRIVAEAAAAGAQPWLGREDHGFPVLHRDSRFSLIALRP